MAKTIVIFADGTGQQFQTNETNIVRLARMLPPPSAASDFYYSPGVGTRGAPSLVPFSGEGAALIAGLANGAGIYQRVGDIYRFLAHNWSPGDALFLFGFSRGAFTVRALGGLLAHVGLMGPGCDDLIPYAIKLYSGYPLGGDRAAMAAHYRLVHRFGETFGCRFPGIEFMGLFDTVKSVFSTDWLAGQRVRVSLASTYANRKVRVVRHAMSVDERRAYFRTNKWRAAEASQTAGTDIRQVWFPGCHGDVGGGFADAESGLSGVTLAWMVREAEAHGLEFEPQRKAAVLAAVPPDVRQPVHESLKGWWKPLEYLPQNPKRGADSSENGGWHLPRGKPRTISPGAVIHQSVFDKIAADAAYRPPNLPAAAGFTVEPW